MRRLRVLAGPVLAVGFLTACGDAGPSAPVVARRPLYFDVKGMLTEQVQQLTQRQAAVTKQVSLRGEATETVRVPAVKWSDELQVFFQADINKVALRGVYVVDSVVLPGGAVRRTYTCRPGQLNAPVARLVVEQRGGKAQKVAAVIVQKNALFATRKQLSMTLQEGRLQRYEVVGTQKLVLFDSLRYTAAGRVE